MLARIANESHVRGFSGLLWFLWGYFSALGTHLHFEAFTFVSRDSALRPHALHEYLESVPSAVLYSVCLHMASLLQWCLQFWKVGEKKWEWRRGDLTGEAMVTEPCLGGRCHPFSHVGSLLSLSRSLFLQSYVMTQWEGCAFWSTGKASVCCLFPSLQDLMITLTELPHPLICKDIHQLMFKKQHIPGAQKRQLLLNTGDGHAENTQVTHRRSRPYRLFIIKLILARTTTQRLFVLFHYKTTKK